MVVHQPAGLTKQRPTAFSEPSSKNCSGTARPSADQRVQNTSRDAMETTRNDKQWTCTSDKTSSKKIVRDGDWREGAALDLFEACRNYDPSKVVEIFAQVDRHEYPSCTIGVAQLVLAKDDFRDTALHHASSCGETDIVRLLLARGAEVNAENNLGSTPLNRAAVAGSVEVMKVLLDGGADIEHADDISGTPLHGATRRNHAKCCSLLLKRGARVNSSDGVGNRPLHLAAAEGAMSALQVLVSHRADAQVRNQRGHTPLDVARSSWIGSHCKHKIEQALASERTVRAP